MLTRTLLHPYVLLTVTATSTILLLYMQRRNPRPCRSLISSSPLSACLPKPCPYPLDALPGGRNVESPYGQMRVYEWGPEQGRKVLLIHGISTPAIALRQLASGLAERGCRVCLFDLWGRGYSSAPLDLPHDIRLYASQILIAITSSPLSWTGAGSGGFALIGYSLGGGIAMSFAASFPDLISSIVLLAPSGILRSVNTNYTRVFLGYPWMFPKSWIRWQVRRVLCGEEPDASVGALEESRLATEFSYLLQRPQPLDIEAVVRWQIDSNSDFIPSFLSARRYAPIFGYDSDWSRVGTRLAEARELARSTNPMNSSPSGSKVFLILGNTDPIIRKDELIEDATKVLGVENLVVKVVDDGHEFPVHRGEEVAQHIFDFWSPENPDFALHFNDAA